MTHTSKQVIWWCSGSSGLGLPSSVTKCVCSRDRRPTVQHEGGEALVSLKAAYTERGADGESELRSYNRQRTPTSQQTLTHGYAICVSSHTYNVHMTAQHAYTLNSNTHQTNLSLPKFIIICSLNRQNKLQKLATIIEKLGFETAGVYLPLHKFKCLCKENELEQAQRKWTSSSCSNIVQSDAKNLIIIHWVTPQWKPWNMTYNISILVFRIGVLYERV